MTGDTPEAAAREVAARVAAALPGEIYAGLEPAFNAFVEELAGALLTFRRAALEEARHAMPPTAEDPNENAYERGRFDGIMEYASAIRALAGSTKEEE